MWSQYMHGIQRFPLAGPTDMEQTSSSHQNPGSYHWVQTTVEDLLFQTSLTPKPLSHV